MDVEKLANIYELVAAIEHEKIVIESMKAENELARFKSQSPIWSRNDFMSIAMIIANIRIRLSDLKKQGDL